MSQKSVLLFVALAALAAGGCGSSDDKGVEGKDSIANELAKVNDPKAPIPKRENLKADPNKSNPTQSATPE